MNFPKCACWVLKFVRGPRTGAHRLPRCTFQTVALGNQHSCGAPAGMGRRQAWGAGRHGVPAPHTLLSCYVNDDAAWVVEGEDVERFDTVNADDELGSAFKR